MLAALTALTALTAPTLLLTALTLLILLTIPHEVDTSKFARWIHPGYNRVY